MKTHRIDDVFPGKEQVSEFLAIPRTPWFHMKIHESVPVRSRVCNKLLFTTASLPCH